jgi:5-methyltetrahydropteroyltriglutamate--homocysteine methyltransferase
MIRTYDAGSLPFTGDWDTFLRGAKVTSFMEALHPAKYASDKRYFENSVKESFLDKVRAGIDVSNYPQFRDMNKMFLNAITGIEKTGQGYVMSDRPIIRRDDLLIPEVSVLKEKSREISEEAGEPICIKLCVTGPYTLSSLFARRRSQLFSHLGIVVSQIIESNVFSNRYGGVVLVSVDEPVFGFLDDPMLDRGSEGREELLRAWEQICYTAKSKSVQTCIHLHNTSNQLYWQVKSLDVVESHVNDPLYTAQRTRTLLEREDKFLKASIAITRLDTLIRDAIQKNGLTDENVINTQVGETWTAIRKEQQNPMAFLESVEIMTKRLKKIVDRFDENRVLYAGPECGFQSFPTYATALECLRRTALAVKNVNSKDS